jgi:hypothetical protein
MINELFQAWPKVLNRVQSGEYGGQPMSKDTLLSSNQCSETRNLWIGALSYI